MINFIRETNEAYHASPAVSASKLKCFERSPKYFFHKHIAKELKGPPTPAQNLGSAIHCAVLEPSMFGSLYAELPRVDRRTKAGKAEYEEWLNHHGDKTGLKAEEYETVQRVRDALNPIMEPLLVDAEVEASVRVDTEYGWLQCRPDCVTAKGEIIDIKTIRDIASLRNQFWSLNYHLQDALYRIVLDYASDDDYQPGPIRFVFVETAPPYETAQVVVDPETAILSKHYTFSLLQKLWECRRKDEWPGLYEGALPAELSAPAWLQTKLQEHASDSLVGLQALSVFEGEAQP